MNSNEVYFLQSDWSRGSTPVLGKPPKQSRDSLEDAANIILRTTVETVPVSSVHTPTTSAVTPTLSIDKAQEVSADKSVNIKPSEFLPKFAAVLDKNAGPVLNSVAALETKRAYDSRTRLRSMLAVIAGEGILFYLLSYHRIDILLYILCFPYFYLSFFLLPSSLCLCIFGNIYVTFHPVSLLLCLHQTNTDVAF